MNDVLIVPIAQRHRDDWDRLYAGYANFYRVEQTSEMRERVWSWLHDTHHPSEGLIAQTPDGRAIGLAHFRPFARPLSATTGGYLDDLYVDPGIRGKRVGDLLLAELADIGRARGWSVIRWITAEDNSRARALYDRVAKLTAWKTYDITL